MFEKQTTEQRDAWLRKVRNVDAALKTSLSEATPEKKLGRRLHLVPSLSALHISHEHKTAAA